MTNMCKMVKDKCKCIVKLRNYLLWLYLIHCVASSTYIFNPNKQFFKIKVEKLLLNTEGHGLYENTTKENSTNMVFENISKEKVNNIENTNSNLLNHINIVIHEENKHMRYRHHHNEIGSKRKKLRSVDEFPISTSYIRSPAVSLHWPVKKEAIIEGQCYNFICFCLVFCNPLEHL